MASITETKLIICLVLIGIIIILAFFVSRFYISVLYEKRIKMYSLSAPRDEYKSYSDKSIGFIESIMKLLSKLLNKSEIARRASKRYERYNSYSGNSYELIDYISIKVMVVLLIEILYILSIGLKLIKFNILVFIISLIVPYIIPDIVIKIMLKNKEKLLEDQLLQAIVIMNGAFKSGKNINDAIDTVRMELENPIKTEFDTIYKDMNYGLSLSEAFDRFSKRIKLDQAKYITASLSLLSKTGGNIVTVFSMIEQNFYNKLKIKNELHALTSSSKFLYRMLCFIPFGVILFVVVLDASYFIPLVTTEIGFIITGMILILYFVYLIIIRKVMRVEEVWQTKLYLEESTLKRLLKS